MNTTFRSEYVRSIASFPTNVHEETKVIRQQVDTLRRMARACVTLGLGNDGLANRLLDIADELEGSESAIREHVTASVQAGYQSAMARVGGVLSAMARRAEKEEAK